MSVMSVMKGERSVGLRHSVAAILIAGAFLLGGCALAFGYRHVDWLIRWQVDHYLDLTSGQRKELVSRLKPLVSRHRREALPQYEQFLKELQQRVNRGMGREDMEWVYAAYDRFRTDLLERALPDGSAILATVNEKQIRHLEQEFSKDEAKAARLLQAPAAVRIDERAQKFLALAQEWLGPLSTEQIAHIRNASRALPDSLPVWWQYRRHREKELIALLRHPAPAEDVSRDLRRLFVRPGETIPFHYGETEMEVRAALTGLVVETDRLLTPLQRRKAVSSIQGVIDDLQSLIRNS
jgi:hypothetical protein